MPHAWLLVIAAAVGCALGPTEPLQVMSADASTGDPSIALDVRPHRVVAHVEHDGGRRRVRVRDVGDGRIEIDVHGRREHIAPWSKCAKAFSHRTIAVDVGGLAPGRYRVELGPHRSGGC